MNLRETTMDIATSDALADGKLDLVPMIDCIMLLLLFFILTTRFVSEEKGISSLLPSTGQLATTTFTPPPEPVNVCIYPAGLDRGLRPMDYYQRLRELQGATPASISRVWVRIGRAEPLLVDGRAMSSITKARSTAVVADVDRYVASCLTSFENPAIAGRAGQCPVIIHCFSGLSWKFALAAYDAVRAYEGPLMRATQGPASMVLDPTTTREVDLAPPRIRDSSADELGNELFEIVNFR